MHETDLSERALFEHALSSVRAVPAPVAEIRRRASKRRAVLRMRRFCALAAAFCVVFAFAPAGSRVIAAVKALFVPTDPQRVIVLSVRTGGQSADYARLASLERAQSLMPFDILVPPARAGWRLVTVMASESVREPSVELLYRGPEDTWVKVSERPSTASARASDTDLSDLVRNGETVSKPVGGVVLTVTQPVKGRSRTFVAHGVRATVAASGASKDIDRVLATPLTVAKSKPRPMLRVTTSPSQR
jgi:hypothetical protein